MTLIGCIFVPFLVIGAVPNWWSQRGVLDPNASPGDYALANQGQLKNIATAAVAEFDEHLPGGAGDTLHSLVNGWNQPNAQRNDFAPVNLGQLKNALRPFYDRLIAVGYADTYPWTGVSNSPDDFAIANIGQVKNLFSFDLLATDIVHDSDQNGLPDWWEKYYFGHIGVDPNGDADLDGRSNFDEFLHGADPNDYDEGRVAALEIVSGNGLRGFPSRFLPFSLTVRVSYGGSALPNALVRFSVSQGSARLSTAPDTVAQSALDVRTDANGLASVYAILGATQHETSVIEAGFANQITDFTETSLAAPSAKVAAGDYHSLALDPDGTVWMWGDNSYGQLGDGTFGSRAIPFQNRNLSGVVDVTGGPNHSVAIEANGTVWAWGPNWNGQLGDGTTVQHLIPNQVSGLTGAIAVGAGSYHTIALRADGTVWAWGYNGDGELGDGTGDDSYVPVEVITESGHPLHDVVAIAAGSYHNVAVKSDGTVWTWGYNGDGELGDGTNTDRHYATQVPSLSNVLRVKAGAYHSAALTGGDAMQLRAGVWAWGANFAAQLGNGTFEDSNVPVAIASSGDVVDFAEGYSHTVALKSDGTVWAWGSNVAGESSGESTLPVADPVVVPGLASIVSVAAGSAHSLALATNGLIYAWGANGSRQLGIGTGRSESAPTPTLKDSNRSGMPDFWQLQYFGRIGVNPIGDDDYDGLTNAQEYALGTDPLNSDTDGDGVFDGADGWPRDQDLHPPRLPEYKYAVIDLGKGAARAINNNNEIVGDNGNGFVWKKGVRQDLPDRGNATFAVGINDDGIALFNADSARPAVWVNGVFNEILNGADSQGRVFWDPNIVWGFGYPASTSGINNSGQIAGNIAATGSYVPFSGFATSRAATWTSSDARPNLLFGTQDANDRILNVDDSRPHDYYKDYNQTADSTKFGGHYDNRGGWDDQPFAAGINNQGQIVGGSFHQDNLDEFGFPLNSQIAYFPPRKNYLAITLWTNGVPEEIARGDYLLAQGINDDGIIVGRAPEVDPPTSTTNFDTVIWVEVNGEWKLKNLGVSDPQAIRRINRNLQIISGRLLYQNAQPVDLSTRIPSNYRNFRAFGINEAGLMVGQADIDSGGAILPDHAVFLVPAALVSDANRDGKIDDRDRDVITTNNPYRFWINDDDDDANTGGDDVPSGGGGNGIDTVVNGTRDLVDFFPVYLDLKQVLEALPSDQYDYTLVCDDPFLNYLVTDLKPETVRDYLTKLDSTTGELDAAGVLSNQPVKRIVQGGQKLDPAFLAKIKDDGKGIILLEAWSKITHPLKLQVTKRSGGALTAEIELPLSIDDVEKMYRHVNFLYVDNAEGGRLTETREPPNYPDNLTNDKTFVFVHGYNVNPDQARGWNAQMFKSMWWSGSRAKFYGTTWHSDEKGAAVVPDYHKNVDNAFATAGHLALVLANLVPDATIAAHSLGNIVVGSAIQDWGATPANYFMIDAAVPLEAYSGDGVIDDAMTHPAWNDYQSAPDQNYKGGDRVYASEWHANPEFVQGDARRSLTWHDRLSRVGPNTYNFFSSSEDVLQKHEGDPGLLDVVRLALTGGRFAWALQEKLKGRQIAIEIEQLGGIGRIGSTYGGWRFSENIGDPPRTPSPTEAAQLDNASLKANPVFDPGFKLIISSPSPEYPNGQIVKDLHAGAPDWIIDLTNPNNGSAAAQAHGNQLLAEMFPARTLPVGANRASVFAPVGGADRNLDMPELYKNDWPAERGNDSDWRHSDVKDVAYTFVYRVFEKFTTLGGLEQ